MTNPAASSIDSFEASFRKTLQGDIDRAAGTGNYRTLSNLARRGYAGHAVVEKILELAQSPDVPAPKIYDALGHAAQSIGDVSHSLSDAAEARGEGKAVRAALVKALDYLCAKNDPQANDAIMRILRSTQIYTRLQLEVMATKGNDRAVPLIENYAQYDDPYENERAKKKLEMLQAIDTPLAIAAIGRMVSDHNNDYKVIEILKKIGERAVPVLEEITKLPNPYRAS